jgi:hypothetical protein
LGPCAASCAGAARLGAPRAQPCAAAWLSRPLTPSKTAHTAGPPPAPAWPSLQGPPLALAYTRLCRKPARGTGAAARSGPIRERCPPPPGVARLHAFAAEAPRPAALIAQSIACYSRLLVRRPTWPPLRPSPQRTAAREPLPPQELGRICSPGALARTPLAAPGPGMPVGRGARSRLQSRTTGPPRPAGGPRRLPPRAARGRRCRARRQALRALAARPHRARWPRRV